MSTSGKSPVFSIPIAPHSSRSGKTETTTTPPPTTPPPIDPHEYEKASFKSKLDDHAYDLLKDHIRRVQGLPVAEPYLKRRRRSTAAQPPRVAPRGNETSRIRAQLRRHHLLQRSGHLTLGKQLTPEEEAALVNKAKHLTAQQMDERSHSQEIEYLKYLAEHTTQSQFRPNRASEYRFKHNRGEPMITGTLQYNFEIFEKPPFVMVRDHKPPPRWKMPPIDKTKEIWFLPVQDDEGIPLHLQMKTPPSKPQYGRKATRRPLKKHAKHARPPTQIEPTRRPPWNYHIPSGYMQDGDQEPAVGNSRA